MKFPTSAWAMAANASNSRSVGVMVGIFTVLSLSVPVPAQTPSAQQTWELRGQVTECGSHYGLEGDGPEALPTRSLSKFLHAHPECKDKPLYIQQWHARPQSVEQVLKNDGTELQEWQQTK